MYFKMNATVEDRADVVGKVVKKVYANVTHWPQTTREPKAATTIPLHPHTNANLLIIFNYLIGL